MKVIYEANDGTKFEAKEDCEVYEANNVNLIHSVKLYDVLFDCNYHREMEDALDLIDCVCMIIENIEEINKVLGVEPKVKGKYTFKASDGQEYIAVDDPDSSCTNCAFKSVKHLEDGDCVNSKAVFNCFHRDILWIKQ